MTGREQRLRERIDWLTDQRDAALSDLHQARAERKKQMDRVSVARKRTATWRLRAEHLAVENRRLRRALNLLGVSVAEAVAMATTSAEFTSAGSGTSLDGMGAAAREGGNAT